MQARGEAVARMAAHREAQVVALSGSPEAVAREAALRVEQQHEYLSIMAQAHHGLL